MDGQKIIETIKSGGVGILPTDTLYGIVASAMDEHAVRRVYKLKERRKDKAVIILIADTRDLDQFGIVLSKEQQVFLSKNWPGAVSVILPCQNPQFKHLHRGLESLALRVPDNDELRAFLRKAGPIIAPSANREGESPATTIEQAKMYFGDDVDFYIDGGALESEPSTLVSLLGENPNVLRQGIGKVL